MEGTPALATIQTIFAGIRAPQRRISARKPWNGLKGVLQASYGAVVAIIKPSPSLACGSPYPGGMSDKPGYRHRHSSESERAGQSSSL